MEVTQKISTNLLTTSVFWRHDQPGYLSWDLDNNSTELSFRLKVWADAMLRTRQFDSELEKRGKALFNILFPKSQKLARNAFREFSSSYLNHELDSLPKDYKPPRLFVRLIPHETGSSLIVPLGMLAVDVQTNKGTQNKFLGFYVQIETPLENQSYEISSACLRDWTFVLPRHGREATLDKSLNRVKSWVPIWKKKAGIWNNKTNQGSYFEDMMDFSDWISRESITSPTTLVILSHHKPGILEFEEGNLVSEGEVLRSFKQPSVVVLAGCSTGSPKEGPLLFVRQFNLRGFRTIIATSNEVDAYMAGDYLDLLAKILNEDKELLLVDVHFKVLQALRKLRPQGGNLPYGPRVLEFSLLGNGNVKLCFPE